MEIASIYSNISRNTILYDRRLGKQGIVFGTIAQISIQYGVTTEQEGKLLKFSAPKRRLQMFAEKLHFAGINFWE